MYWPALSQSQFDLFNNGQAWVMVPRKEGKAINQTEPNDNRVSGSHPPCTITMTSNTNAYHILTMARGRGRPGIKAQCELSDSINEMRMT